MICLDEKESYGREDQDLVVKAHTAKAAQEDEIRTNPPGDHEPFGLPGSGSIRITGDADRRASVRAEAHRDRRACPPKTPCLAAVVEAVSPEQPPRRAAVAGHPRFQPPPCSL